MADATTSTDMDAFLTTANDAAARTELGLGSAATLAASAVAQTANNLSDLASAATARTNLGLGTVATLASDTDVTLAANSDARVATQKATKAYVDGVVTGLLDFKGSTDCSTNPNYPAASKGDSYVVSVAGKIGGASGVDVAIGDVFFATADNAGGTQAAVGTSWTVLEHNIPDLASIATTGSASDLSTGTVPDARFPATLPALNGSALTNLNATNLASGTVPDARFPATLPAVSGVNLTNLNATQLTTGTVPDARFPATLPAIRIKPRVGTVASDAAPTINTDNVDVFTITALAAAITSFTTNLSGTPNTEQPLIIRILDNGTARAITWGASFASRGATLPTTTVLGKYLRVGLRWNEVATVWDCVSVAQEI